MKRHYDQAKKKKIQEKKESKMKRDNMLTFRFILEDELNSNKSSILSEIGD